MDILPCTGYHVLVLLGKHSSDRGLLCTTERDPMECENPGQLFKARDHGSNSWRNWSGGRFFHHLSAPSNYLQLEPCAAKEDWLGSSIPGGHLVCSMHLAGDCSR